MHLNDWGRVEMMGINNIKCSHCEKKVKTEKEL